MAIVHPAFLSSRNTPTYFARRAVRYVQRSIDRSYRPDNWLRVDDRIEMLWKPSLHPSHIPNADIVVATSWLTAEWVAKYPASKGKKFYFIQGFETWYGSEDREKATWHLPLKKIVIARWLREISAAMNEEATYVPNGLDFETFGIDVDPGNRLRDRVMMLYHQSERKGSADGIAALGLARERVPALEGVLFGTPPAPKGLPSWMRYYRNPPQATLRQLYNDAVVFLAPSWEEGWGLTASEALQCGCALAATDVGGYREFCIPNETALLSPPKDPELLASNLVRLLQDRDLRVRLACSGNEYVQQFTWDRAGDAFEAALAAGLAADRESSGDRRA